MNLQHGLPASIPGNSPVPFSHTSTHSVPKLTGSMVLPGSDLLCEHRTTDTPRAEEQKPHSAAACWVSSVRKNISRCSLLTHSGVGRRRTKRIISKSLWLHLSWSMKHAQPRSAHFLRTRVQGKEGMRRV